MPMTSVEPLLFRGRPAAGWVVCLSQKLPIPFLNQIGADDRRSSKRFMLRRNNVSSFPNCFPMELSEGAGEN